MCTNKVSLTLTIVLTYVSISYHPFAHGVRIWDAFSKYTPQINSNRLHKQDRNKQVHHLICSPSSTQIRIKLHSTHVYPNSLCTFECLPLTIMYAYDTVLHREQLRF